ncbi:hypothetical protein SAMD00023353_1900340 [Rosellinia necatrix]|uniref:DUF7918 domain-containing protein n=1 Tax=Rosellinia necatrix TaxID=77044 RepID=A0A1W2TES7_ROSNE|nr:hypothetical protein SAMD00023353_1900340 [Rosellinia necatrix]
MAVLTEVPGIEVTVNVNGQRATEYADPHASKPSPEVNPSCPVSSKYIESIDNAEFSISLAATNDNVFMWNNTEYRLRADVKVDTKWVSSSLLTRDRGRRTVRGLKQYSGESRQWHLRKLKFSPIGTVDNQDVEQVENDAKSMKGLGLIEVSFDRCVMLHRKNPMSESFTNADSRVVAEKALKGNTVSHSASMGGIEIIATPRSWECCPVEGHHGPVAIFLFLYRSREGLRQALVIPRTPSPELASRTISRSVKNMTVSELQILAQERLDKIKEEKSCNESVTKRKVNELIDVDGEAEKARAAKRPVITIDLTDD